MKVSLNSLKNFTDISMPVDELISKIGAQLGAIEEVINLSDRYKDALIVKVVKSDKHNDADKLSVCLVDDGGKFANIERDQDGLLQIVCGAPNVKAGMLAVWLPPGSVVPSTVDKDPFTLETREIRGTKSNGMLASAKELGIGDSHEGLLVVDKEASPGDSFSTTYKLDDHIIDIENKMFTHRPDLFGALGIAREIAGISGQSFASPRWYSQVDTGSWTAQNEDLASLSVENHAPSVVPRLMTTCMSGVTIAHSPIWLQVFLSKLGLRPINNIVDMTNFIMVVTGQPIHCYDFDKVKSLSGETPKLIARLSQQGEKLTLLNGKEINLDEGAVVIATDQKAIGLGGVMGGAETEVDESTKNIIIECANFDMNLTRKTAMRYGLFTDAVTRFTKGQSPRQNPYVLQEAISMATDLSGAVVSGTLSDIKSPDFSEEPNQLSANVEFINSRLGLGLTGEQMKHLLENVEFRVELSGQDLNITVPFWRIDIEIQEDVVEEIGRLYGYDHLPLNLPLRSIKPAPQVSNFEFKAKVRRVLAQSGANEVLTYSFTNERLLTTAGQNTDRSFHIKNALSPALQYYRQSLTPSLLAHIHLNIKNGYEKFAIFEIGKGHMKGSEDEQGLPKEFNLLSLVFTQNKTADGSGAAYFQARNYLDRFAEKLGIILDYQPIEKELDIPFAAPYELSRSVLVSVQDGALLGILGEFKDNVINGLKLPAATAGFELALDDLETSTRPTNYFPLNKFPEISQDICLKTAADLPHKEIEGLIRSELDNATKSSGYKYSLSTIDIFQKPEETDSKQTTWRLTLMHPDRTLTSEEVNKIFDMLENSAKSKFNAERI